MARHRHGRSTLAHRALAPVSDLVGAHHNRLSDGGNAVARWMGSEPETDPEAWRLADPMQQSIDARILLLHGAVDQEVPISMSETYVRRCAAIGAPVQFERLEGDHYDVIDVGSSAWAAIETSVLDWYDSHDMAKAPAMEPASWW